ncbi:transcriptional regulator [Nocardioides sp. WS12]|uniref:transcriptional regulator n=1 Tax=Nocardioides sp. WS12 TaxID=2486272 RepID=UPI001F18CEDB|nr:transcriptional regulator [Nocardioides sp. WS12]
MVSSELGVSVSTLIGWSKDPDAFERRRASCARCGSARLPASAYAALLGFYLGDGHIARGPRYFALRVSCDNTYLSIIEDVAACMAAVHPNGRIAQLRRPGCINVQSTWQHWPCLFPQHGPGPKHKRPIVLDDWQRTIVEDHPGPFLRGLFHSDGSRVKNWARRPVAGQPKTYEYPRWQFVNASQDIRELCCWALDLVDIPWRQSNVRVISVSRREAVARLDELIGLKS